MDKIFKSTDINFVAYLRTKGIKYNSVEISKKERAMFSFAEDFDFMMKEQEMYKNDAVEVNIQEYMNSRNYILDIVKAVCR